METPEPPNGGPAADPASEELDLTPMPEMVLGEFEATTPPGPRPGGEPVGSALFSSDGPHWPPSERIHSWDAEDGLARISEMTGLGEGERYVSISADGSTLATLNLEGTVRIWDVPTGGEPAHTHSGLTADPMSMLVSADGAHVAVTDLAGMLYLLSDGGTETVEAHTGSAYLAHFSPADDLVATHGEDMEIRMWDPETGAEEVTLTGHTGPVRDTSFSGDGTLLASSAGDGTARWWDLDEPGEIGMAEFEGEGPYAVAASSDDRLVGVVDEPEGSPVLETGSG
ncbi:WD40 repeat domain-containing protein [Nocardiopsis nanhaiensis]